ncbi:hypothetical protein C0389_06835 [bacterium]|nr:hypothetical protein [bacterium]
MIDIKIEGLSALINSMKTVADKTNEAIEGAVKKGAALIVSRAKELCPIQYNRLAPSITDEIKKDNTGILAKIGTNVSYAPYVEYGYLLGKKAKKHGQIPFLYPAFQQNFNRVHELITEAVKSGMGKK